MDQILNAIDDVSRLEENVEAFTRLPKDRKLEVLGALKGIRTETVGSFVSLVYPREMDPQVHKVMRTVLFGLKTVGIRVEEPKAVEGSVLRKIEAERTNRGFLSNYDPQGTRLVMAVFEVKRNNFALFHAITGFSEGLQELMTAPVDKRNLDLIVRQYAEQTQRPFVFVEISPGYAARIIEEASAYSGKFGEDVSRLTQVAAHIKGGIQRPDDLYGMTVPEGTTPLSMEEVLESEVFQSFQLTWETLDQDRKEYEGIGSSSIILPPYMIEEKKQAFLRATLEKCGFSVKVPFMKRMMEDYGYMFYNLKAFGVYLGLMEVLKKPEGPQDALLYYLRKTLERTEEKQPQGLIVSPYEPVRR
jgi:hypothetical protein